MSADAKPKQAAKVLPFKLRLVERKPLGQQPTRQEPCPATVEAAYHLYRRALDGDVQGVAFVLVDRGKVFRHATGLCAGDKSQEAVLELARLQGELMEGDYQ